MAEYRIDELARVAGATVRNIRVYQDRGLLPPPRRDGRVGLYTDAHLARLRLIGQLLKRGYTMHTWQRGWREADGVATGTRNYLFRPPHPEAPAVPTASDQRRFVAA